MHASLLTGLLLSAGLSRAELLTATRVPDPTITKGPDIPIELLKKQAVNDRFMGWVLAAGGTYTSRACDTDATYFQSDNYWRCCATTGNGCNVPIGCVTGSLIYSLGNSGSLGLTTLACSRVYTGPDASRWSLCNTGLIYENTADFNPKTNVFCGANPTRLTYFRVKPADATTTPPSTFSSAARITPILTSTASQPTNPPTPSPSPEPTKEKSKAWIAGAVVGPLVGLALIGLAALFLLRRKKKNKTQAGPPMQQQQQQHIPPGPGPYAGGPAQPSGPSNDMHKPQVFPTGVASHESWAAPPHSPTAQGPYSPQVAQQDPNGQKWQGQQVYPSPTLSPQSVPPYPANGALPSPPNVPAYQVGEAKPVETHAQRHFSAELDGSGAPLLAR